MNNAGVAQLVERNLAKVEVTSSNLVTRSIFPLACPEGPQILQLPGGYLPPIPV